MVGAGWRWLAWMAGFGWLDMAWMAFSQALPPWNARPGRFVGRGYKRPSISPSPLLRHQPPSHALSGYSSGGLAGMLGGVTGGVTGGTRARSIFGNVDYQ